MSHTPHESLESGREPPDPVADYLWDPSSPPEAGVEAVERRLSPLVLASRPLVVPARRSAWRWAFPLAAAVLIAAAIGLYLARASVPARFGPWAIESKAGSVGFTHATNSDDAPLHVLTTDNGAYVVLTDAVGRRVRQDENTRLVFSESGLSLEVGELFVETARGATPLGIRLASGDLVTIGPGAAAMVRRDRSGACRVVLKTGEARLDDGRGTTYRVPAEAVCEVVPGVGLMTPHYYDAPRTLLGGLRSLELSMSNSPKAPGIDESVAVILKSARTRDAMTLWNLLPRVGGEARERIAERLAFLAPSATKEAGPGLRVADPGAMEAWWRAEFPDR
ncbi:MAG: hypothetical protein JNK25_09970 [Phycisphaerae bacterium]|nr:hypothetical protein [Phycisphaerae bacterium]